MLIWVGTCSLSNFNTFNNVYDYFVFMHIDTDLLEQIHPFEVLVVLLSKKKNAKDSLVHRFPVI